MSSSLRLSHLIPVSPYEVLRSTVGAFLGLLCTGLLCSLVLGRASLPLLMAPIGASTVLLFAAPASPLAQPWSILGGNFLAAFIGVTCAKLVPDTMLAAAIAVSVSIGAMMICRCLHPPSGAVALTAVIGGPAISNMDYLFVIWPVATNSVALLLLAVAYNRLAGRQYPHPSARREAPRQGRVSGVTQADVEAAIRARDEVVSVDPADIEEIIHHAEDLAAYRRSRVTTVDELMDKKSATVHPSTSLRHVLRTFRQSGQETLLVVDRSQRLLGSVSQSELLNSGHWAQSYVSSGLGWRLRSVSDRPLRGTVADVMKPIGPVARAGSTARQALMLMLVGQRTDLAVVDANDRVLGIIRQAEVLTSMFGAAVETKHVA